MELFLAAFLVTNNAEVLENIFGCYLFIGHLIVTLEKMERIARFNDADQVIERAGKGAAACVIPRFVV